MAVAVALILLVGSVGLHLYYQEVKAGREFLENARAVLRHSGDDADPVGVGYPHPYIAMRIGRDRLVSREEISRLFVGFAGRKTEERDGYLIDRWELVVGRMTHEFVVVVYRADGSFCEIQSNGPTFR